MQERYIRNIPALSEEECLLLQSKKIGIVGCGGLGGHLTELISRLGCKEIVLIDGDVFEPSNLNRQLYSSTTSLGKSKVVSAAKRVQEINPDIQVTCYETFLTEENASRLIKDCDIILDGLDGIQARKTLKQACNKANIPYIYGAIAGWVAQAAVSMPGDHLLDLIYPEHVEIKDKSALSFTVAFCAAMQVSLCVKVLTERPVKTGTLYYFDLLHQEYEVIPMQ